MNCPKCGTALSEISFKITDRSWAGPGGEWRIMELDRCGDCDGVWFDADELERYVDGGIAVSASRVVEPEKRRSLDEKGGDCPVCAVALQRQPCRTNPRLSIDLCAKCGGVWVDGPELAEAGGKDLPFGERVKAMFGDLKPGG